MLELSGVIPVTNADEVELLEAGNVKDIKRLELDNEDIEKVEKVGVWVFDWVVESTGMIVRTSGIADEVEVEDEICRVVLENGTGLAKLLRSARMRSRDLDDSLTLSFLHLAVADLPRCSKPQQRVRLI